MKGDKHPLERERRKVKPYPNVAAADTVATTATQLRRIGWMKHLKTLAIAYLVLFGALLLVAFVSVVLR